MITKYSRSNELAEDAALTMQRNLNPKTSPHPDPDTRPELQVKP